MSRIVGVNLSAEERARIDAAVSSIGCARGVFAAEALHRFAALCEPGMGVQRVKTFVVPRSVAGLLDVASERTGRRRADLFHECLDRTLGDPQVLATVKGKEPARPRPRGLAAPEAMVSVGIHIRAPERSRIEAAIRQFGCSHAELASTAIRTFAAACQPGRSQQRDRLKLRGFALPYQMVAHVEKMAAEKGRTRADLLRECMRRLLDDPVALAQVPKLRSVVQWSANNRRRPKKP